MNDRGLDNGGARPGSGKRPIPGVRHVIAVASGKGGVGKSTVAINLALALAEHAPRVGLMDCDFYGPSLPSLVGIHERARVDQERRLVPHEVYKLKLMSLGFHVPRGEGVMWRGPMLTNSFMQLVYSTHWGGLDYLILDLPPGTGDVQQTLADVVPVSAAVLVTTPQEVALRDVEKGLAMFRQCNVPVAGIVENMSYFLCGKCSKKHHIFGSKGAEGFAKNAKLEVLGHIPLDTGVPSDTGLGEPLMVRQPESAIAAEFRAIAARVIDFTGALDPEQLASGKWATSGPNALEV
jgi:ATP-binding protein involved in chromosome partitioning